MRYQQKQKEEIERKRSEMAPRTTPLTLDLNENNKIHIGNGKVINESNHCSILLIKLKL